MSDLAPIALFVYNRPWHTEQTVNALLKNELASASDLYIFSDAAKDETSAQAVRDVRSYIETIDGFRQVTIVEQKTNQGLANSIIGGVGRVLDAQDKIIVVEDDLLTSPYFLTYMNEALERFENDDRVISIHGYVYPVEEELPEAFFLAGADCWGWATWRRGWALFDEDGKFLLSELRRRNMIKAFNFNNAYPYSEMLEKQTQGSNDSWAIRWYASAFLADKLTLYPGHSLVHNIGNDSSGTHCADSTVMDARLRETPIDLGSVDVTNCLQARRSFERFFRRSGGKLSSRLLRKARSGVERLFK